MSYIPKSRRTRRSQTDTFIVLDLNRNTETQLSTFGALLHFQYHSCEEIVYFSIDSNPDHAQCVLYPEVTADM